MRHTPGPWRAGTNSDSVVADVPIEDGVKGSNEEPQYYGGYLIAETVHPRNMPLITAAPDLLTALRASDSLIISAQAILARHCNPQPTFTAEEAIEHLLGLLDGPLQRSVQSANLAAITKASGE